MWGGGRFGRQDGSWKEGGARGVEGELGAGGGYGDKFWEAG